MKNFIQNIMDKQGITVENLNCIQKIMLARDMNTSQLSKLTGLSYTTAQNIATGKTDVAKMHVERFLKIAHGLGMTAEELYYGDKRPDKTTRTYADPRQQEINETFEGVTEDGKQVMWTNAVMARTTFPDGVERDDVQEEIAE
jgi:transcriptional regulator with XRE-family HTH domain